MWPSHMLKQYGPFERGVGRANDATVHFSAAHGLLPSNKSNTNKRRESNSPKMDVVNLETCFTIIQQYSGIIYSAFQVRCFSTSNPTG